MNIKENAPIIDCIAAEMADSLSLQTKMGLYQDLKEEYPDQASEVMCKSSIEGALDEFAFMTFWHIMSRFINEVSGDEELMDKFHAMTYEDD